MQVLGLHPRPVESDTRAESPSILQLTSPPGDSDEAGHLRSKENGDPWGMAAPFLNAAPIGGQA